MLVEGSHEIVCKTLSSLPSTYAVSKHSTNVSAFITPSTFPKSTINRAQINDPMYFSFPCSESCVWGSEQQGLRGADLLMSSNASFST